MRSGLKGIVDSACQGNRRKARACSATAESVGYYKPRPEPYQSVLAKLRTDPARTLFVAGSAADVPGAKGVGMPVYWHNRIGLDPISECRPDFTAASLCQLLDLV